MSLMVTASAQIDKQLQLGKEFVVTKGLDGCLFVYSLEEWSRIESKMQETPMTSKESRKFMRFFFAGAANLEVDRQGRILLPLNLREHAGLKKEVVFAGVSTRQGRLFCPDSS